jgi:hypothetical protein
MYVFAKLGKYRLLGRQLAPYRVWACAANHADRAPSAPGQLSQGLQNGAVFQAERRPRQGEFVEMCVEGT